MKQYWGHILRKDIYPFRKRGECFRTGILFLLIAACVLMPACGKKQVRFSFEPSRQLNLDEGGLPLSVVVRIYQLKNRDRFEQADFHSLWKQDREILGKDFLDLREVTLQPDKPVQIDVDRLKASEFVAVMALFRRPDGDQWRQVVPLKGWGRISFEITVGKRVIQFVEK